MYYEIEWNCHHPNWIAFLKGFRAGGAIGLELPLSELDCKTRLTPAMQYSFKYLCVFLLQMLPTSRVVVLT